MAFNPFQTRRMAGILGAGQIPQPTFRRGFVQPQEEIPSIRQRPSEADLYWDEMERVRGNMGPSTRAYREALQTMPTREENKPGWMTRIAAALSGFGAGMRDPSAGFTTASDINESKYRNAMSDYGNRLGTLKESADIEQEDVSSQLKALMQARALGLKYDEFDLKRREAESKMETDRMNAESNRARADAYVKRYGKPSFRYEYQQDGSILEINPDTQTQRVIPARTVQAGQLGVARQNAATNARNAETNVRRTDIYGRAQSDASRRGWTGLSIRNNARTNVPSPAIQQEAEDTALRQMASDPLFRDFIEIDRDGYPMAVPDDGTDDYQDFLMALDAKVDEVLGGRSRRSRR